MEDSALITGIHVINAITVFLSNKNDKRSTIGFFQKHLKKSYQPQAFQRLIVTTE